MLQNAYFLAKIGTDTAENEQHLAEFCQNGQRPYGSSRGRRRELGVLAEGREAGSLPQARVGDYLQG